MKTNKRIECKDCENGIQMCKTRPCWGTVEDFKKIIEAGYAKKLMIDYYSHPDLSNGERIYFLSGASHGNECSKADWNPKGVCIFLENDLCIIHDIKPTIGAISCCKEKDRDYHKEQTHQCLTTWITKEGTQLIEEWKRLVDYVEVEDDAGFNLQTALTFML